MQTQVTITMAEAAKAFAEWWRLFREDPTKFQSDFDDAAATATKQGESSAMFFFKLLNDMS